MTPMWKIFATTFVGLTRLESRMELNLNTVGARPTTPDDIVNDRNLGDPDHLDWSFNPLGKHFVIS